MQRQVLIGITIGSAAPELLYIYQHTEIKY